MILIPQMSHRFRPSRQFKRSLRKSTIPSLDAGQNGQHDCLDARVDVYEIFEPEGEVVGDVEVTRGDAFVVVWGGESLREDLLEELGGESEEGCCGCGGGGGHGVVW